MNFAARAGRRSREYWTGQVSLADEADLQEEADLPFASSKSMRHTSCSRSTVSRSPRPRYLPRPDHARRTVPKWGAKRVSAQMRAEAEQHGRLIWEGTLVELQGMRRGAPSAQTNSFIAMPPSPTGVSASLSLSRSWLACGDVCPAGRLPVTHPRRLHLPTIKSASLTPGRHHRPHCAFRAVIEIRLPHKDHPYQSHN